MTISITCACGADYRVGDHLAGKKIRCKTCNTVIPVEAGATQPAGLTNGRSMTEEPSVDPAQTRECPFCAEIILRKAIRCKHCGETVTPHLDAADLAELRSKAVQSVDDFLSDAGQTMENEALRAGTISVKSIVLAILSLVSVGLLGYALSGAHNDGYVFLGIVMSLILVPAILVSLIHDVSASRIADSKNAKQALSRWYMALRTSRTAKAYSVVAPEGRIAEDIPSVQFQSIKAHKSKFSYQDVPSFRKFWKSIFRGPAWHSRTARVTKIASTQPDTDGFAVASVTIAYTSYPTAAILGILGGVLPLLILILVLQKSEKQVIRKVLLQRQGKWFVLEGQYQGPLDNVEIWKKEEA